MANSKKNANLRRSLDQPDTLLQGLVPLWSSDQEFEVGPRLTRCVDAKTLIHTGVMRVQIGDCQSLKKQALRDSSFVTPRPLINQQRTPALFYYKHYKASGCGCLWY